MLTSAQKKVGNTRQELTVTMRNVLDNNPTQLSPWVLSLKMGTYGDTLRYRAVQCIGHDARLALASQAYTHASKNSDGSTPQLADEAAGLHITEQSGEATSLTVGMSLTDDES